MTNETIGIGIAVASLSALSFMVWRFARLEYYFPDQCGPLRELREHVKEAPTVSDRLERIERELEAIRKEAA